MELNFKHFGQGEPLIIIHGLFGMLDNWQSIAKKLAEKNEVFIIDQRNHGKSPHSNEHSYLLMARDLLDFFQEQNIYSAHLLGHSMGGKTAMQFATLYPGYVKSLIIADIFPKEYTRIPDDHQMVFSAINALKNCQFIDRKLAEKKLEQIIPDIRILQFMYKNLTISDKGCIRWKFNADVLIREHMNLMENIQFSTKVNVPVLFIKGSLSDYINESEFPSVYKFFPRSTLKTIERAGHWIHADNPELFTKIVGKFLSEN